MRTIKKITYGIGLLVAAFFVIFLPGCNKGNPSATIPQGTYTGKFIYSSSLGILYTHGVVPGDITFTNSGYTSTSNLPNGGYGTYQTQADSVSFRWSNPVPLPTQGSMLVLDGTYEYHFEVDSLIITKYVPNLLATTQFRLKRN